MIPGTAFPGDLLDPAHGADVALRDGHELLAAMKKEAALKDACLDGARFEGLEAEALREERESAWEERLVALAQAAGVELKKLGPRKSAPEKVLLAAAMKETTSVSNGWLSDRLAERSAGDGRAGVGEPVRAALDARQAEATVRR